MVSLKSCSQVEHASRAFEGPAHPTTLHAIFDQVAAGALDDSGGNRVAAAQVLVVSHIVGVFLKVAADAIQGFGLLANKFPCRAQATKPSNNTLHIALQYF